MDCQQFALQLPLIIMNAFSLQKSPWIRRQRRFWHILLTWKETWAFWQVLLMAKVYEIDIIFQETVVQ